MRSPPSTMSFVRYLITSFARASALPCSSCTCTTRSRSSDARNPSASSAARHHATRSWCSRYGPKYHTWWCGWPSPSRAGVHSNARKNTYDRVPPHHTVPALRAPTSRLSVLENGRHAPRAALMRERMAIRGEWGIVSVTSRSRHCASSLRELVSPSRRARAITASRHAVNRSRLFAAMRPRHSMHTSPARHRRGSSNVAPQHVHSTLVGSASSPHVRARSKRSSAPRARARCHRPASFTASAPSPRPTAASSRSTALPVSTRATRRR